MSTHKQVSVIHPRSGRIEVDEELAPMLEKLWALGVDTTLSCQDEQGCVWLQFAEASDAEHFLGLVARHLPTDDLARDPVYLRMTDPLAASAWRYDLYPLDVDIEPQRPLSGAAFVLGISIRLPRCDYAAVLDALADAAKAELPSAGHR